MRFVRRVVALPCGTSGETSECARARIVDINGVYHLTNARAGDRADAETSRQRSRASGQRFVRRTRFVSAIRRFRFRVYVRCKSRISGLIIDSRTHARTQKNMKSL
jgi:hypothetical protein